jgi:hypothetical protein
MVKREFVDGHQTSLESQPNHHHAVFGQPGLVPEPARGFVGKPPANVPSPALIQPNPPGK